MKPHRNKWDELPLWMLPPGVKRAGRPAKVPADVRRAYGETPRDLHVDALWSWYVATHAALTDTRFELDMVRTKGEAATRERDTLTGRADQLATILGQTIGVTNGPALTCEALAEHANKFRIDTVTRRATLDQLAKLVGMPSAGAISDLDRLVDYVRSRCENDKALREARDRLGVPSYTPGTLRDVVLAAIDELLAARRTDAAKLADQQAITRALVDRSSIWQNAFYRACDVIDMAAAPSVTETLRGFVDGKMAELDRGADEQDDVS